MMSDKRILLFLVDDDALFLKSLEIEFAQSDQYAIRTFATGELCLDSMAQNPDIVVLDYYLNGVDETAINGLETLDRIKECSIITPVIMLSSQDSIEVAVNCMKHHAFDYIVKSETAFIRLQKTISTLLHNQKMEKTLNWYMDKI